MSEFVRVLRGSWSNASPTNAIHPGSRSDALIRISEDVPTAIRTEVGCQRGWMHYALAASMGVAMLEAAAEASKSDTSLPEPILVLTDKFDKDHFRAGVVAIEYYSSKLTLLFKGGETEIIRPQYRISTKISSVSESLKDALEKISVFLPTLNLFTNPEGGEPLEPPEAH